MISSEMLAKLEAFFKESQLSWKPQVLSADKTRALAVAYVDARDVARRLDQVCGGEWSFTWEAVDATYVKGSLSICGTVRQDVGEKGDGEAGETLKAAVSDALKRCAVLFGVGRYLYYLPGVWVGYDKEKKCFTEIPGLPTWARVPTDEVKQEATKPTEELKGPPADGDGKEKLAAEGPAPAQPAPDWTRSANEREEFKAFRTKYTLSDTDCKRLAGKALGQDKPLTYFREFPGDRAALELAILNQLEIESAKKETA